MNKLLEEQIKSHLGGWDKIPDELKTLFNEIDTTYNRMSDGNELNNMNLELRQSAIEQGSIIENLKKAIAVLEPNSKIFEQNLPVDNQLDYLTNTLIQLVEAEKKSSQTLKEQKEQLEKLNNLLTQEKFQLASERAKDQAVLLAIADGLIVCDKNANILMVNNAFESLMGFKKEEVIAHNLYNVVRKENKVGQLVPVNERLNERAMKFARKYSTSPESTFFYIRKDNTKFPVMVSVAPISLNGEIIGTVEVFQDVTRIKEIDKAKSEFVSLASHQLRTPLSSINWYVEMLLDDNLQGSEDDYKSYLGEIDHAAERMSDMINALLNVSRLELGTFAIDLEQVNVLDIVKKIINELKPKILEREHKVEGRYNDQIPKIESDAKLLSMVFQNLISNAVKYTPAKGNIVITIDLNKEHSGLIVSVADNGYGIPDSEKDKIFSKLFRAKNVTKHDTDGNGLGLYIAKAILDELGGKIWFESQEKKGTTFFFTIPLIAPRLEKEGKTLN